MIYDYPNKKENKKIYSLIIYAVTIVSPAFVLYVIHHYHLNIIIS
jgi:hypothetical protein